MVIKTAYCMAWGLCLGLIHASSAWSQYRIQHQAPVLAERGSAPDLTFYVPAINPADVLDAFLFYRMDGDIAYQQEKAELRQSTFHVRLNIPPGSATVLEYYFQIRFNDGSMQTYPANAEAGEPVRVEIVEERQAEQSASGKGSGIEYTILSPEQGGEVRPGDAVIAITLFYEEGTVDTAASSFRLLLNGIDVTEEADISSYFLAYVPDELPPGEYMVSLQLKTGQTTKEVVSWNFTVADMSADAISFSGSDPENRAPRGQVELSARNQVIAGGVNNALSGTVRLSGQKGAIRYSAYGLLTSQEDPRLQPQNRYGAELYIGDWFELRAGHIYPVLSPLTIAGQRVRGVSAALHAFNNAMNMQFIYGKLRRGISNLYGTIQVLPQSFNGVVTDTSYALDIREGGFGTFQRDIIGGRLGLGRGDHFQLGFNLLKVQDDTNSIHVLTNYREVINRRPQIAQSLGPEDRSRLENEPGLLSVNGNPLPKGNLVAGPDLMINLHNNRIQFRTDGAVSLLNENINGGALTRERAEELGFEIDHNVENLLDQLSWLIIINENMNSLPLRFKVNDGETSAEAFFPTGILATQSELSFNYFKNNLRLQYRWVGPNFNSLANPTIRQDIAGYTISDRFRLFRNRIYVTLGYENLNDNVTNIRDATTNTVTLRSNVSWYPISQSLPRVSIGLMNRTRENGVELFNPFVPSPLENAAVKNYRNTEGEAVIAPLAHMANTIQFTSSISQQFRLFGLIHDASLNYSQLNTTDDFFRYGQARSNSISLYITNRFHDRPLDTRIGFSINNTQTGGGLTDIRIFGFNAGGTLFLLRDKLTVDAAIAFTRNKTEIIPLIISENGTPDDDADDYYEPGIPGRSTSVSHSYIFSAGALYTINQNHAFAVDMRFTNVTSPISSLSIPNDRILQARYIFSF